MLAFLYIFYLSQLNMRQNKIVVYLTDQELEQSKQLASKKLLGVSPYFRMVILENLNKSLVVSSN